MPSLFEGMEGMQGSPGVTLSFAVDCSSQSNGQCSTGAESESNSHKVTGVSERRLSNISQCPSWGEVTILILNSCYLEYVWTGQQWSFTWPCLQGLCSELRVVGECTLTFFF